MKSKILLFLFTLLLFPSHSLFALSLRANHPNHYVVQPGDTLWGISTKFLNKPWEWKQIWHNNPHIKNPDIIYPGAVIEFHRSKRGPYLVWARGGTIKLSPRVKRRRLRNAIPPVSLHLIQSFLNDSMVFEENELKTAPYVVAYAEDHLAGGKGAHIFVSGLEGKPHQNYSIYRDSGAYRDPTCKCILGYGATHIGDARLIKNGNPATLLLTEAHKEIKQTDRVLLTHKPPFSRFFIPQAPNVTVSGQIISFFGGATLVGDHEAVVINRGHSHGLRPGDVLALVAKEKEKVLDPIHGKRLIPLPNERKGEIMIFRTFDRISFGLVMKALKPIYLADLVTNP